METRKTPKGITLTSDKEDCLPNKTVTLTVTLGENIVLDDLIAYYRNSSGSVTKKGQWSPLDDPENVEVKLSKVSATQYTTQYTFLMPKYDVYVYSTCHYEGAHAINLSSNLKDFVNNIVVNDITATAANEGDEIRVETNGRFKDLKITKADNTVIKDEEIINDFSTYSFKMPAGAVTISGTPLYSLYLNSSGDGKATLSVDGKELTPEKTGEYFLPANTTVTVTAVPDKKNVASVSIWYYESGKRECPQKTGEDNTYTYVFETRAEGSNLDIIFGEAKTITFEPNGGTETQTTIKIPEYGFFQLPKCAFTAPNKDMSFAGWYLNDPYGQIYAPGYIYCVYDDMQFTAAWIDKNNGFGVITRGSGDEAKTTAIFDDSKEKVSIDEGQTVDNIQFTRQFNLETMSTIVFPFNYKYKPNAEVYDFTSVHYDKQKGKWVATISPVNEITANTPYLIKTYSNAPIKINDKITLEPTKQTEYSKESENGDWIFYATYVAKEWDENNLTVPTYGFAGVDDNDIKAGDFVRVAAGASIAPMRCYLTYKNELTKSAAELPDVIEVVIVDKDETINEPDEIVTPVAKTEAAKPEANVWSFDRTIYIEAQPNTEYTIIDLGGRKLKTGVTQSTREQITLARRTNGIVIVVINGKAFKLGY